MLSPGNGAVGRRPDKLKESMFIVTVPKMMLLHSKDFSLLGNF